MQIDRVSAGISHAELEPYETLILFCQGSTHGTVSGMLHDGYGREKRVREIIAVASNHRSEVGSRLTGRWTWL